MPKTKYVRAPTSYEPNTNPITPPTDGLTPDRDFHFSSYHAAASADKDTHHTPVRSPHSSNLTPKATPVSVSHVFAGLIELFSTMGIIPIEILTADSFYAVHFNIPSTLKLSKTRANLLTTWYFAGLSLFCASVADVKFTASNVTNTMFRAAKHFLSRGSYSPDFIRMHLFGNNAVGYLHRPGIGHKNTRTLSDRVDQTTFEGWLRTGCSISVPEYVKSDILGGYDIYPASEHPPPVFSNLGAYRYSTLDSSTPASKLPSFLSALSVHLTRASVIIPSFTSTFKRCLATLNIKYTGASDTTMSLPIIVNVAPGFKPAGPKPINLSYDDFLVFLTSSVTTLNGFRIPIVGEATYVINHLTPYHPTDSYVRLARDSVLGPLNSDNKKVTIIALKGEGKSTLVKSLARVYENYIRGPLMFKDSDDYGQWLFYLSTVREMFWMENEIKHSPSLTYQSVLSSVGEFLEYKKDHPDIPSLFDSLMYSLLSCYPDIFMAYMTLKPLTPSEHSRYVVLMDAFNQMFVSFNMHSLFSQKHYEEGIMITDEYKNCFRFVCLDHVLSDSNRCKTALATVAMQNIGVPFLNQIKRSTLRGDSDARAIAGVLLGEFYDKISERVMSILSPSQVLQMFGCFASINENGEMAYSLEG